MNDGIVIHAARWPLRRALRRSGRRAFGRTAGRRFRRLRRHFHAGRTSRPAGSQRWHVTIRRLRATHDDDRWPLWRRRVGWTIVGGLPFPTPASHQDQQCGDAEQCLRELWALLRRASLLRGPFRLLRPRRRADRLRNRWHRHWPGLNLGWRRGAELLLLRRRAHRVRWHLRRRRRAERLLGRRRRTPLLRGRWRAVGLHGRRCHRQVQNVVDVLPLIVNVRRCRGRVVRRLRQIVRRVVGLVVLVVAPVKIVVIGGVVRCRWIVSQVYLIRHRRRQRRRFRAVAAGWGGWRRRWAVAAKRGRWCRRRTVAFKRRRWRRRRTVTAKRRRRRSGLRAVAAITAIRRRRWGRVVTIAATKWRTISRSSVH